jgi:release factor glutamine methyltransferase
VDVNADDKDEARFIGLTVLEGLVQARDEFVSAENTIGTSNDNGDDAASGSKDIDTADLEPDMSSVQLMALALQLPWDTGFRELQQLLTSYDSKSQSGTSSLLASTGTFQTRQSHNARRLSLDESQQLHSYIQRRLCFEPLQYICGQWDFLDYTLIVRPPLLCPRPETEELVQLVLNDQDVASMLLHTTDENNGKMSNGLLRILDVGCGTGCIGIALADQIGQKCRVTAIDVEPIAVATAAENAHRILCKDDDNTAVTATNAAPCSTDVTTKSSSATAAVVGPADRYFYESDSYRVKLASAQDYILNENEDLFHVVVSNPPYIPAADMERLDPVVARYESATALYGGSNDGMAVIRTIVERLPSWCHVNAICWMEVDPSHPPILQRWLQDVDIMKPGATDQSSASASASKKVVFLGAHQDLSGRSRFVKLRVVGAAS